MHVAFFALKLLDALNRGEVEWKHRAMGTPRLPGGGHEVLLPLHG
jgi:hypothetical protein